MISIAEIKRPAEPPAQADDPDKVAKRDREDEKRDENGHGMRILAVVKMRQDGHDGEQVADEMAAGVAEERGGFRKIIWEKSNQRTAHDQAKKCDQVLAFDGGNHGEKKGAEATQARAKAVHVVHEVEGVDNGENPEHGDGIAEGKILDEEGDADIARGDEAGDDELATKFCGRAQFNFVIQTAKDDDAKSARDDGGEFKTAHLQAMRQEPVGQTKARKVPMDHGRPGEQGQNHAGEHTEAAGKGDRSFVDFAMAGVVHQTGAAAEGAPDWQSQAGNRAGAKKRGYVDVERKIHGDGKLRSAASFRYRAYK
jgi:hypothetical protein